jgi:hypothetical protein
MESQRKHPSDTTLSQHEYFRDRKIAFSASPRPFATEIGYSILCEDFIHGLHTDKVIMRVASLSGMMIDLRPKPFIPKGICATANIVLRIEVAVSK